MQDNGAAVKIKWSIREVISSALHTFAENWLPLMVAQVVLVGCFLVPVTVWGAMAGGAVLFGQRTIEAHEHASLIVLGVTGGLTAIGCFTLFLMVWPSVLRMVVAAARGQRVRIADLFSRPFQRSGTLLVASLLICLLLIAGFCVVIIGAVAVVLCTSMTFNFVVEDEQLSAWQSIKASWRMMRLHTTRYVLLLIAVAIPTFLFEAILGQSHWLTWAYLAFQLASTSFQWVVNATLYTRLRPLPAPLAAAEPVAATA